ncbi:MAG TPA: DJ-1/PfpI family protein [Candidatus Babeliales bacterium]|jgi:putative intracellular protease/amidase|nr:DJ-1/PfpI family protein [Candidatus Babeliales bacterium]
MDEITVLLIIASEGFQQVEYGITKKILTDAGFIVVTASNTSGTAVAKDGSTTHIDITLEAVMVNNYAGIFFIGGPGALEHLDNNTSYKIIQEAFYQHRPIGAICIATRILAKTNVLRNKYVTGWNDDGLLNALYKECGAVYLPEEKVVVDSNTITATDPSAAQQFGEKIVELLQSKQRWG